MPAIISIVFTDLFDSVSTFLALAQTSGLKDAEGNPKNLRQGLIVDAWATLCAGLFGTSAGTAYIESATGVEAGGRTGWTAVVTAFCFLPFLFLAPLLAWVPAQASAAILIVVGALMLRQITLLKSDQWQEWYAAIFTMVLIPFSFSITQGILWGL